MSPNISIYHPLPISSTFPDPASSTFLERPSQSATKLRHQSDLLVRNFYRSWTSSWSFAWSHSWTERKLSEAFWAVFEVPLTSLRSSPKLVSKTLNFQDSLNLSYQWWWLTMFDLAFVSFGDLDLRTDWDPWCRYAKQIYWSSLSSFDQYPPAAKIRGLKTSFSRFLKQALVVESALDWCLISTFELWQPTLQFSNPAQASLRVVDLEHRCRPNLDPKRSQSRPRYLDRTSFCSQIVYGSAPPRRRILSAL